MIARLFVFIFLQCYSVIGSHVEHISVLSTDFTKDQVVYHHPVTTDSEVSYRIDFTPDLCPEDIFAIDEDDGDLSLLRTVNFTQQYNSVVQCVENSSSVNDNNNNNNTDEFYPVVESYYCFITRTTPQSSTGLIVVIDVVPDANSISWEFSESIYMASSVGGTSGLIYTDGSLVIVSPLPHSSALLKYELQSAGDDKFVLRQETVQCTSHAKITVVLPIIQQQPPTLHNLTLQALPSHSLSVILVQVTYANYYSPVLMNNLSTILIPADTPRGSIVAALQCQDKDSGPAGTLRYRITGGDGMLGINPVTGAVSLLTDIDTNYNNITVLVYDLGQPQFSIESTLMIFIDVFNEYTPNINVTSRSNNIGELTPFGTTVATLVVQGMDSVNISVSLNCVTCSQVFQLTTCENVTDLADVKYDIVLTQTLNYEQTQSYDLIISATDGELSAQETLTIRVEDENEPPYFTHSDYSVSVSEGALVGTQLITITAEDEDSNDELVYSIVAGNTKNSFSIEQHTGLICTSIKLQSGTALLNVSVSDSQIIVYTLATIIITPLDTSKPDFSAPIFSSSVYENISDTIPVFSFSATDDDQGCPGAVQYTILNAEPPYFTIDSMSGLLYVEAPGLLDYEEITSALVTIRATSLGEYKDKFSNVVLNLTILNVNDNPPVIDPINCPCFLEEGSSALQSCQELHSIDRDGDNIEYILVGNSSKVFSIDSLSGVVSTSSGLDHEEHNSYTLYVAATDGGLVSEPIKLVIQVLDINDSPPVYSGHITLSVPQDTPTGSALGSVAAVQHDAGFNAITNHTFIASTPQNVMDTFLIDPLSGQLYLSTEVFSGISYTFTVMATDVLDPSQEDSTTVTVNIEDNRNIAPQFTIAYDKRVVSSNLPLESVVASVSATDENGDSVEYGLSSDTFHINSQTGEITLKQVLSSDLGDYRLNISATDGSSSSSHLTLDISVYEPNTVISDVEYTQNAGVGVCSYTGYVNEGITGIVPVVSMETTQGGQSIAYGIFGGEHQNSFSISGNVVEAVGTDDNVFTRTKHETIFITVRAIYGSLFHLCSVTIIINDINDHGPVFDNTEYNIEVYRSVPIGSSVFQFQATDVDYGANSTSKYTLLTQSVPFEVHIKTGHTRLTGLLNQNMYTLHVLAEDDKNSSLNDTTTLVITVLSTTNTPPQFSGKIPAITVSENQSVGSSVMALQVHVSDPDDGVQGKLAYCVLGGAAGYFGVNSNGEVQVISELDYESLQHSAEYNISVMVYDASPNPKMTQRSFIILLEDLNDESPTFLSSTYVTSLLEKSNQGTPVITVTAYDADMGSNGVVRYSLSQPDNRFTIDPESGIISTTSVLIDRDTLINDTISLTVVATDQGTSLTHSATATVNIMISDKNDFRPYFVNPVMSTVSLPESQAPGTVICTVEAIDNDYGLNGEVRYTIEKNDLFFINSVTGEISLYRAVDYERDNVNNYNLQVSAKDLGDVTLIALPITINFQITDINDNYPLFSHTVYSCSVREDTVTLSVDSATFPNEPCNVNASDSDRTGNTISYSIEDINSLFNIDGSTGIITLKTMTEIDYERTPYHILVVTAVDSGTPTLSTKAVVLVNIIDTNDEHPKPDPLDTIWVPEALPPNAVLFNCHAVDEDEEDSTLMYSLLSETSVFNINSKTGDIQLENYLYYYYTDSNNQYNITILAIDAEGNSNGRTYSLNVLPINNNPTPPRFTPSNPLIIDVPLSTPIGTTVVMLDAVDPEERDDNHIEYYMVGNSYFSINKVKGDVFVSDSLVGLNGQSMTVSAIAIDSGSPSLFSVYNLTILITNDPNAKPFFNSPEYHMTVSESKSNEDHIVGHVVALVNNRYHSEVLYNVPKQDTLPFTINATTGAIHVSGSLDREDMPTYFFTVEAYRPALNLTNSTAVVFVTVTDVNDFLPSFPSSFSQITIPSSFPVNETIFRLFVIDKDDTVNAVSTFTRTPTDSPFNINITTGEITLTAPPTSNEYNVTVIARNPPLQERQFDMMIQTAVPVVSPITCTNDTISIPEDTSVGTLIHTVDASSGSVFYSLTDDSFAVHPSTGEMFLTQLLDREQQDRYDMLVKVWDGVSNRVNCSVTVIVSEVNNNRPMFGYSSYEFEVVENSPVGQLVGILSVTDNDLHESLTFDIVDWLNPNNSYLFVVNSTGHVLVSGSIDGEQLPQDIVFTVSVAADQNQNRGFANVVIEILDENDQKPVFSHNYPDIVVSENVNIGTVVMKVAAFDPDKDSLISYELLSSGSAPFIINNTTGIIITSGLIDYEATTSYQLQVIATDTADPSLNDTITLNISVYNEIDTHPVLVNNSDPISVSENLDPGSFVTMISAVDHPHAVVYTLADDAHHFSIEPFSGVLRITRPLDYEEEPMYTLTVIGSFSDHFYSETTVVVNVLDENDHSPVVTPTDLTFVVAENALISTETVFDLGIVDLDSGSNGVIQDVLILDPDSEEVFQISSTGKATLKQPLDRERRDFYFFEVFLLDGGAPARYSQYAVAVTVNDSNDNPPVFSKDSYHFIVSAPVVVNEELFQVSASDEDDQQDTAITYTLTTGHTDTFEVDVHTGVFSIHNNLNLKQFYNLTVLAADSGGLNTSVIVTVQIKYCGFNMLSFQPAHYTVHVPEDTPVDSRVLSPSLNDFDQPGSFLFYQSVINEHFIINSSTGELFLRKEIDFESIHTTYLLLQVNDTDSPSLRIAEATVTVFVTDVNDNPPVFTDTPYAVFVRDDKEVGSSVFTVTATDRDEGVNSELSYSILSQSAADFNINRTTGVISLSSPLTAISHGARIEVVVAASDNGENPSLTTNETLVVTVLNSNAPNFSQAIYTTTVPESTVSSTVILTIQSYSSDPDAQLFYSIVDTNDAKFPFSIDPNNGELTVNDRGLDREGTAFYSFFVQSEDTTSGLSTQVEVQITIQDVNDKAPEFSQPLYIVTVDEDILVNTPVLNVSATDGDTEPFAQIIYYLESSTAPFRINPISGMVYSTMLLDYEMVSSYELKVVANDSGSVPLQGSASIRVILNNVNDNPPVIETTSSGMLTVSEFPSPGTLVTLISATDPDGDEIEYNLEPTEGSDNFKVTVDGLLQVSDLEDTVLNEPSYVLVVTATDSLFIVNATVTVHVVDINDHSPMFSQETYYANITENSPEGVYVTTVSASDGDRGSNAEIEYSVNLDEFNVDSNTGVITTSKTSIDREKTQVYNLIVIARDGGDRTDTATITVSVKDINDNSPQFTQSSYVVFIPEESMIGTSVLTVTALDPDEGPNGTVSYELFTNNNISVPFEINSATGLVIVFGDINFEVKANWTFDVMATDGGGLQSAISMVTVNLINIADANPQFSQGVYHLSVPEYTPFSSPIFTPNVTFPDPCNTVEFSIYEAAAVPFSINTDSGVISVAGSLVRLTKNLYTFNILVKCSIFNNVKLMVEEYFGTASVNIAITDVNESPSVKSIFSKSVSEAAPINTTVIIIQGSDNDLGENGTLRYGISTGGTAPFHIDPIKGALMTEDLLDRETEHLYLLTVIVSDLGNPPLTDSAIVVISIKDENDSPPQFVCENVTEQKKCTFNVSVPEDTSTDTPIVTLLINDPDSTGSFSFQVTSSMFSVNSSYDANDKITGGVVSNVQALDRETRDWYEFEVVVSDGIHSAAAIVLINITDVNDEDPMFMAESYQVSVEENYPPNKVFITIEATDDDEGINAEVTYSLLSAPLLNNLTINSTTGELFFIKSPDYEVSHRIELFAQASDPDGRSDTVTIAIDILDQNDNAPVFSDIIYTAGVYENTVPDTSVRYVTATDEDSKENGAVLYYLGEGFEEHFQISSMTGLIIVSNSPLDRETIDTTNITVIARDSGTPQLSSTADVVITILDVNDNAPVFDSPNYIAAVSEFADVGTTVINATASDKDKGSNAELSFFLTGPDRDDFVLKSSGNNAAVSVGQKLNHESISDYQLMLEAVDNGIPSKTAAATLSIHVSDENDNHPIFLRQKYDAEVAENISVGSVILTVKASDLDSNDANLTYTILQKGEGNFTVGLTSGEIQVNHPLDHETTQLYLFTVIASEQRPNPQTAQAEVEITIQDINDNPPEFVCLGLELCPSRIFTILENQPSQVLGNFSVRDLDSVTNINAVSFSVTSSSSVDSNGQPLFSIDPLSGQFSVLMPLDREQQGVHHLTIAANDNGSPPLIGTSTLTVVVEDLNDNGPVGVDQRVYVYLKNGELGSNSLGGVALSDIDIVNSHQFIRITSHDSIHVSTSGEMTINSSAISVGPHILEVNITDTLYNGTVTYTATTVTFEIRDVTMETIQNSINMLLVGITPERFVENHLVVFTEVLKSHLYMNSNVHGITDPDLLIFSITTSSEYGINPSTELFLAVRHAEHSSYIHEHLLLYLLRINRRSIEQEANVNILTEQIGYCSQEPCSNHGLCSAKNRHYLNQLPAFNKHTSTVYHGLGTHRLVKCTCYGGRAGQTCSDNKLSCDQLTCGDNAQCIDLPDITGCQCDQGYIGESCDIPVVSHDLCESSPCRNGASCSFSSAGLTCTCQTGFTGELCVKEADSSQDACLTNPCLHGGTCIWDKNYNTSYSCVCPLGYTGDHCQIFLYSDNVCSSECEGCVYSSYGGDAYCVTTAATCLNLSCPPNTSCVETLGVCEDECSPNPCLHGGQCVRQLPGSYCMCPEGFEGPNCELVTATLSSEDSLILLPPLQPNGEISLEFISEDNNGTLLYVGRADDTSLDHMLLYIEEGYVNCELSLGEEENPFHFVFSEFAVNNGNWYTISLDYDTQAVNMSVTRYTSPYLNQKQSMSTNNHFHLDVTMPTIIGKIPTELGNVTSTNLDTTALIGCVQNVIINGEYQDFSMVLYQQHVDTGCSFTDDNCNIGLCLNGGVCRGQWVGFDCVCPTDYMGDICSEEADSAYLDGYSYIQYQIISDKRTEKRQTIVYYSSATSTITLSFSTISVNGLLVQLGNNNSDHIIIHVVNGYIAFSVKLDGGMASSAINIVAINDGVFHNITFTRTGSKVKLLLDNMYVSQDIVPGTDELLDVGSNEIYVGSDPELTNGFTGCVYGLKFDNKDMPVSNMNEHFIATHSGGKVVHPCLMTTLGTDVPFYEVFETLYILVGVAVGFLVILSIFFVIVSKSSHYCYVKRKDEFQPQTQRTDHFSAILPSSINTVSYQGIDRGYLQQTNSFEHLEIVETEPIKDQQYTQPSTSTSVTMEIPPSPRVAHPKVKTSRPPNPQRQLNPKLSNKTTQPPNKRQLDPMTGMPLCDSDSDQSNKSLTTTTTNEEDMYQFIMAKVNRINRQPVKSYDEMWAYDEEGPYDPLGSLGSLYDILNEEEEEEEEEVRIVKMEVHLQSSSGCEQPPPPSPLLSSYSLSPTKSPKNKPIRVLGGSPKLSPKILRRVIHSGKRAKPMDKEKLLLLREFTDGHSPHWLNHHPVTGEFVNETQLV